jgi:hypothetical protein
MSLLRALAYKLNYKGKLVNTAVENQIRPARSCDAPSQKNAGDALVASWLGGFSGVWKKCNEASLPPFGDAASSLLATGNFRVRDYGNSSCVNCNARQVSHAGQTAGHGSALQWVPI